MGLYDSLEEVLTPYANAIKSKADKSDYVGMKRYLNEEDDVFALSVGSYGISSASNKKPANMPSDFSKTANGYVIVLDSESNSTKVAFAIQAYAKKIWLRTGYEWLELAKLGTVNTLISDAVDSLESYSDTSVGNAVNEIYSFIQTNLIPEFINATKHFYQKGTEISTSKTQFKFIDAEGVKDVGTSYPDWYVTDEIAITPFTFYCITASARSANHFLYAIYDEDNNVVASEASTSWDIVSITDKVIFTPYNASKIRLASVKGTNELSIYNTEESEFKKWSGKKWVCIGDSLTAENIRTTKHYHDYIAEKTGINVVNMGAGGTGYKKEYAGVGAFMDRVNNIPLDADVVTIFGSGNDYSYTIGSPSDVGTETLCGCINTTIGLIFDRITTCNLGIVTPTPWQGYNPADDTNWMAQYSAAIVEICKRWGVPCLDLYHCSNLRPWDSDFRQAAYSKDDGGGTHPDETGHALIAPRFENFLNGMLLN